MGFRAMCEPDVDQLDVGERVRVFKTHAAGTLWLYDPETGQPAENGYVPEGHAEGVIRETNPAIWPAGVYRVTVVRDGRELYADWSARHWIRRPDEPEPEGWQRDFTEDEEDLGPDHSPGAADVLPGITCTIPGHCRGNRTRLT